MISEKILFLFGFSLLGLHQDVHAERSCGLVNIPENTSPTNLYTLPPFAENLPDKARAWTHPYHGTVNGVLVQSSNQTRYMTASYIASSKNYYLAANNITKDFVREQKTREMLRFITLKCSDGTLSAKYYLKILFQDVERPEFSPNEYYLTITKDWDLEKRPISDGHFIIVSDNNVELEDGRKELQFASPEGMINRVDSHPLWVLPSPDKYYFRLDIFLNSDIKLEPGKNFQISLSAQDDYNSGTAKININVSD